MVRRLSGRLPDFPWDTIARAKQTAAAHPGGLVDLSVGTPVDPTPPVGARALAEASDSPGYPVTTGTPALRSAMVGYLAGRWNAANLGVDGVLPVLGTKELVAWLPTQLGLGSGDTVAFPTAAYPTYAVGALLAGCRPLPVDHPDDLGDDRPALVWLNSPSNPTGAILDIDQLTAWVRWARDHDAVIASDECYGEFGWEADPVSVLDPRVCGDRHDGLLAVHSLSKRSNLAGYRAGFVGGDAAIVTELLAVRKHSGMIMPGPVQATMAVLLADHDHVQVQRERYLNRRRLLAPALERAGFRVDHSEGGLYLWVTRDEDGRASVDFLASHGILAAPGDFYGDAARQHVRLALTAPDERVTAAAERLAG